MNPGSHERRRERTAKPDAPPEVRQRSSVVAPTDGRSLHDEARGQLRDLCQERRREWAGERVAEPAPGRSLACLVACAEEVGPSSARPLRAPAPRCAGSFANLHTAGGGIRPVYRASFPGSTQPDRAAIYRRQAPHRLQGRKLLTATVKRGGATSRGASLPDGFTWSMSSRWQTVASIPEDKFEASIAHAKATGGNSQ